MSRVGKYPVTVPKGVTVSLAEGQFAAKGAKGELKFPVSDLVEIVIDGDKVAVKPKALTSQHRAMWGTTRAHINNMVKGVSEGFTKKLEITGTGYRAAVQGQELVLALGYSHDIKYAIPKGISIVCEKPTSIAVSGSDVQVVGQIAAEIRAYRGPEPYKGKGVRYADEVINRKEGKKK